jgi:hypothetical protein
MAQCLGVDPYQAIGVPQQQSVSLIHLTKQFNFIISLLSPRGRVMARPIPGQLAAAPSHAKQGHPFSHQLHHPDRPQLPRIFTPR